MLSTVLLSPIHDPEGRLLRALKASISDLEALYARLIFSATSTTAPEVRGFLDKRESVTLLSRSDGSYGGAARAAFTEALQLPESHRYHWIDSDRVLHWIKTFPDEIAEILHSVSGRHYMILGRTKRALATHPESWRYCETPCNRIATHYFGVDIDICVANFILSREAILLLEKSRSKGWGILTEWPLLVADKYGKGAIGYVEVEGNEWEDPDYYQHEIATAGGLAQWSGKRYNSVAEWSKRLQNSIDILEPMLTHAGDPCQGDQRKTGSPHGCAGMPHME